MLRLATLSRGFLATSVRSSTASAVSSLSHHAASPALFRTAFGAPAVAAPSFIAIRSYFSDVKLNDLRPAEGSTRPRKRVGRGIGSGTGKTAGRGHKGQKSRSGTGKPYVGFEGGQTPLYKRVRKYGFTNASNLVYQPVNLDTIQKYVSEKKLDASQPISMQSLVDVGLLKTLRFPGVKLLGRGSDDFSLPLQIEVSQASRSAVEAVRKNGGDVVSRYYDRVAFEFMRKPSRWNNKAPHVPLPPRRLIPKYEDAATGGYLAGREPKISDVLKLNRFTLQKETEEEA